MSRPTRPLPTDAELMVPVMRFFGFLAAMASALVFIMGGIEVVNARGISLEACGAANQKSARACRAGAHLLSQFPDGSQWFLLSAFSFCVGGLSLWIAWRIIRPVLFKRQVEKTPVR